MPEMELLEKVREKARRQLGRWERLSEAEQAETAEMIVAAAFIESADQIAGIIIWYALDHRAHPQWTPFKRVLCESSGAPCATCRGRWCVKGA